jgi:hypothetical protein
MMGRVQQTQYNYLVPVLIIIGISFFVLYLSGNAVSGELVRRPSPILPAPSQPIISQPIIQPSSNVELSLKGSLDSYWLDFTNRQGTRYSFRYLTSFNNIYKYGDASGDLIFVEASSPDNPNIGIGDSFVLSNQQHPYDISATSHIIHYTQFDPLNRIISFLEQGSGLRQYYYQCTNPNPPPAPCIVPGYPGRAILVYGGHTYLTRIDANGNLAIDMNGNGGNYAISGIKVNLVALEQSSSGQFTPVVIDLGTPRYSGNGLTIPLGTPIPLVFYQGDPTLQRVVVATTQITAVRIPGTTTPLTVLQAASVKSPH